MERRNFIKAGVVAGGSVGFSAVGCGAMMEGMSAVPVPTLAELESLDMGGFLQRLDSSLGFIQSTSTLDSVVSKEAQRTGRSDPRFEHSDELVRKTLRSMLLVGSFGDLPEHGRVHPGMQARLWSSMQEMDDAVFGMNSTLASFTPTERADVGRMMREDATAGVRILDALDEEAVKAGVNEKRRTHMREVGKQACFRLRQSTSLFIDEYGDKVKKVAAREASVEEFQRRLQAQMGETAFWEFHRRQFALAQAWQHVPGIAQAYPPGGGTAAPPGMLYGPDGKLYPANSPHPDATGGVSPYPAATPFPYAYADAPREEVDEQGRSVKKVKRGTILLAVGGGLLGLGAIAGISAALMVASPSTQVGGYFVVTAAVLLGLGGIGCLIAGAIIRARA